MKIEEKSNSMLVEIEEGEELLACLNSIAEKYHLVESIISGVGLSSVVDYGIAESVEPIFFKKLRTTEPLTISSINGFVSIDSIDIYFLGVNKDEKIFTGKLFSLTTSRKINLKIDILKTE